VLQTVFVRVKLCTEPKPRKLRAEVYSFYGSTALVSHGLLTLQVSRTHSVRHTTLDRTPLDE
jgi:hypothetical protein